MAITLLGITAPAESFWALFYNEIRWDATYLDASGYSVREVSPGVLGVELHLQNGASTMLVSGKTGNVRTMESGWPDRYCLASQITGYSDGNGSWNIGNLCTIPASSVNVCGGSDVRLAFAEVLPGARFDCSATSKMETYAYFTVHESGTAVMSAPVVTLRPGFAVKAGGSAVIRATTTASRPDGSGATNPVGQRLRSAFGNPDGKIQAIPAHPVAFDALPGLLRDILIRIKDGGGMSSEVWGDAADGRFVFATDYPLLPEVDRNGAFDVWLWTVDSGPALLSGGLDGAAGNGPSQWPRINGAGDRVVWHSEASDLVEDDTNEARDVFTVAIDELGAVEPVMRVTEDGYGSELASGGGYPSIAGETIAYLAEGAEGDGRQFYLIEAGGFRERISYATEGGVAYVASHGALQPDGEWTVHLEWKHGTTPEPECDLVLWNRLHGQRLRWTCDEQVSGYREIEAYPELEIAEEDPAQRRVVWKGAKGEQIGTVVLDLRRIAHPKRVD